jgi:heat shock protein HslJ
MDHDSGPLCRLIAPSNGAMRRLPVSSVRGRCVMDQRRWVGSRAWLLLLSTLGVCLTLGTAGSGLHSAQADSSLDGTWWLVSTGERPPVEMPTHEVPFFAITDMTVHGFDGCNNFFGSLAQPGEINSTRLGCPDSAVRLPLDLNNLLTHLKTGRIENNALIVPAWKNFPKAIFVRHDEAPQSPDPRSEEDIAIPAR